jgi:UDPglucose 6-dehydrogenase
VANIGFIGLGKLGLPCAAAMSVKTGNRIYGFDVNTDVKNYIDLKKVPYMENNIEEYLRNANITFCKSIEEVIRICDVIFIAVQTPHEEEFEGNTPVPERTSDFNYEYLINVSGQIADIEAKYIKKKKLIVIISTVLPGTIRSKILPIFSEVYENFDICYNPYFIAMGDTINDFLNPEFVLIGSDSPSAMTKLESFYKDFQTAQTRKMSIESAELTKVAYNTFIGFKIVFANLLGEIMQEINGNVDEVTGALSQANIRLLSPKYLSAGMADGGGCHPRDQIAMSWLAKSLNLSVNPFDWLARARDAQTKKQSEMIIEYHKSHNLPIIILGKSYKSNVNLIVGSPSRLLCHYLDSKGINYECHDNFVDKKKTSYVEKAIFFVATNHDYIKEIIFPQGSVLIDPWGNMINRRTNYKSLIITPGRN